MAFSPLSHGAVSLHSNPQLNPHRNSVPFTRPFRRSEFGDAAASFHVTRVRDRIVMVFASLIQLLFLFFWLRSRRCRRIRARRIRLLSWDHAFTRAASLRWTSTARTTVVVSACLLEESRLNRQLRVRPRTSSFYQDTVLGWSEAEFKENFRVCR